MIDSTITLEGLFTYVFFTSIQRDEDGNPSKYYNRAKETYL